MRALPKKDSSYSPAGSAVRIKWVARAREYACPYEGRVLGGRPLVDPSLEEEALCEGVLEACVGEAGELGPVSLRGRGALEPAALAAALEAACVAGTEAQTSLSAEAAGQRAERDKVEAEMVA